MEFPTLYKRTSTGATQQWLIYTIDNTVYTKHGQVDGAIQVTFDIITKGKNVGKINETSPEKQAEAEAAAKWDRKLKSGYVEDINKAKAGEDDVIGGILPMLAHSFKDKADKVKFPAFVQPKLDGLRCVAIVKDGKATLWSRTRKPINSMPHIVDDLEVIFSDIDITLDGELYQHDYKSEFEKIVSLVRKDAPGEGHEIVEYHVYDQISKQDFNNRFGKVKDLLEGVKPSIKVVETEIVNSEEEIFAAFEKYRALGYEGAMVRNAWSDYVNKRSVDLLKVKEMDDSEFDIVGISEGRGKLAGHAIFVCKTPEGTEFEAKMKGDTARLKEFFDDHSLWAGKQLTVQFQGYTSTNKVPRFPVGLRIREPE